MTACSAPPVYWSTGSQAAARAGGTAAGRAVHVDEPFVAGQRRLAGRLELRVLRQKHGELVLRNGDGAALLAVDDRDGRAPVALAGDQPVAGGGGERELCPGA